MRHQKLSLAVPAILCAALLSGCWSGSPDKTEILVVTTPPGASCELTRLGQPIGSVTSTPAIALVEPGPSEIAINCSRPGFADVAATLPALETSPGFGAFVFGGSASDYQRRVDIALAPR